ncbi:lipocalin family protein [Flavobacteriaceae bacterium 3-367]|uniref:lipocalin family protein n=1 Tax=Eudoraea algarum TaxID=3417568 RepID=UPI003271F070
MGRIGWIGITLLIVGCTNKVSREDLRHLNGYWAIEKVVFQDGKDKAYKLSTTIDYLEVEQLQGFRKKVQPRLDGTYTTTDDAIFFEIYEREGTFQIRYQKVLDPWEEKIVTLTENNFSVTNDAGLTYFYKRYRPINVNE